MAEFRNVTLKCLAEIAALSVGPEYDPKFAILFAMVMTSVNRMIPPSTDIAEAYANASDAGQELVLNLALFLTNFLSNHLRPVESLASQSHAPNQSHPTPRFSTTMALDRTRSCS